MIEGEKDYSGWVIMAVAERPTWEVAVGFAISVALLILCFSQLDKAEDRARGNR